MLRTFVYELKANERSGILCIRERESCENE